MDYTFKMLRNNTPVDDYATAIMLLDAYPYHLIGPYQSGIGRMRAILTLKLYLQ